MSNIVCRLRKLGDVLAIPLFLLLIYYLLMKRHRSFVENLLLFFAVIGFIADLTFSGEWLTTNAKC
jgi:hypothetical protein